jgi:8-oxo-dGTP diphosphatase
MGWVGNIGEKIGGGGQTPVRFRRGVKANITNGSAVLLVKERHNDGTAFWTLPGGGVQDGESREAALRRELREELDCSIRIRDSGTTIWYAHNSETALLSAYRILNAELISSLEPNPHEGVYECRWIDVDSLPARTIPQVRYQIQSS